VLEVAEAQEVKRFLYLSSTEVYGNVDGTIDETFPLKSMGSPYGDAKIEAERLCWEHYKRGLPVTVVRPSIVYGPFSTDWTVALAQRLQSGNWGIFKSHGDGICNLVYVADVVSGILLAARNERAIGEAFNLVGPESMTWNQYFGRFASALSLPELRVIDPDSARLRAAVMDPIRSSGRFVLQHLSAPLRKLSQANRQARQVLQYLERTLKTNPRTSELSLYKREAHYLSTKACDVLGYQPAFGVDRGLELSVQWLRTVGLASLNVP
jgi:nucleoside-diphosphate-sugar epimerase